MQKSCAPTVPCSVFFWGADAWRSCLNCTNCQPLPCALCGARCFNKICSEPSFGWLNLGWTLAKTLRSPIYCGHALSLSSTSPPKLALLQVVLEECLAEQVGQALGALMDAVEVYFRARLQNMTGQILVSALVSVATLSSFEALSLAMLFGSICNTLLLKSSELSFNNKTQVGVACQMMSRHNEQAVQAVSMSCSETCPELAIYFRFDAPQPPV